MPPMVGQITLFPYDFDPVDWMTCDGSVIPISENDELFLLLGTTFGGDGNTTFALPNLQNITPRGCRYCIATKGFFNSFVERVMTEIVLAVAGATSPQLVECAGQQLPVNQNQFLFHYLGNRFGGDNARFNLPDLRGKAPANCRYSFSLRGNPPMSPSDNWLLGEIVLLPLEVQTDKLALCNGQLLPTQNSALFMLLGNRFGGDNQRFALPDLRASAPPKHNYYMTMVGGFPSRG